MDSSPASPTGLPTAGNNAGSPKAPRQHTSFRLPGGRTIVALVLLAVVVPVIFLLASVDAAIDGDNDGYSDDLENYMGTNANVNCPATTAPNDEAVDAWPPDFNDDRVVDLTDVTMLRNRFGSVVGDGTYSARFDLNGDGQINVLEVSAVRIYYNQVCEPALVPTDTPTPAPTPPNPPSSGDWAFEETFDGAPSSPQPYSSNRFDIVVGANDPDAIIDGQTIISDNPYVDEDGTIEAAHGSDCGSPIDNIHIINVDFDEQGFQTNTRPQLVYQCNNHMMTTVKAGYGVISLQPRQLFDWQGRTGTIEMDTNVYGWFRNWVDVYIVPEDEMLQEMVHVNEGGTGEQFPKRAVRFSFAEGKPRVAVIDNYQIVYEWKHWEQFQDAFPSDPAPEDPRIRRNFRMQFSKTGWSVSVEKADGSYWTHTGSFPQQLSFTRGLVRFGHHSYNPTKDGILGEPWSQYTFHWDNLRFDGPVIAARQAFEAPPTFIKVPTSTYGTPSSPVSFYVGSTNQPRLIGHVFSQSGVTDPANNSHWGQVQVNGGAWKDIKLRKPVDAGISDRSWSTVDTSLTGIVVGQNTLRFRYNTRPPGATWQPDNMYIKDIEVQVEDRVLVAAAQSAPAGDAYLSIFDCSFPVAAKPAADLQTFNGTASQANSAPTS